MSLTLPFSAKLTALPGVGPTLAEALAQAEILTVRDLLWTLPYRYVDRGTVQAIGALDRHWHDIGRYDPKAPVTLLGTLTDVRQSTTRVQRMALTEALLTDASGGSLRLVWFNQAYLAKALHKGDQLLVFGPLSMNRTGLAMQGPAFEILARASAASAQETPWVRRFLPLYHKQGPLTSRTLARLTQKALAHLDAGDQWLPGELSKGLPDLEDALRNLHQPQDDANANDLESACTPAHERLATEELFAFALGMVIRRQHRLQRQCAPLPTSPALRERLKSFLPFSLTQAQRRAFKDIVDDLCSTQVMHRMLQGDVGSGKTLVAFLAMAMVAETGGQAALLAPTEVLARQHFATFSKLLGPEVNRLQLLLGPMKAREKREALQRIAQGQAHYVVGTHAIFQEAVQFAQLQLVVVDEQHRFGVKQREALKNKGIDPHWLVMSATPIPRSLALTLFGDLAHSVLDELPPGRQPIHTRLLSPDDAERAWHLVETEIAEGGQAYVVSPAIDPSEDAKVCLRDIQAMEALLRARFPKVGIEVVHGRLKPAEMETRMARFVSGESPLLIATTVIEVGVDVPRATVMVVDHAERFGLSQLHQLRGRVGRGSRKSHFVMLSDSETERLQVLVSTQDGFKVAQKDLEIRGPGEFFGVRQSGLPRFQVADLLRDKDRFLQCKAVAERFALQGLNESQQTWLKQEEARQRLAEVS